MENANISIRGAAMNVTMITELKIINAVIMDTVGIVLGQNIMVTVKESVADTQKKTPQRLLRMPWNQVKLVSYLEIDCIKKVVRMKIASLKLNIVSGWSIWSYFRTEYDGIGWRRNVYEGENQNVRQ